MAFALNFSEFLLIGKTSFLTLAVSGVSKEVLLVGFSLALFHDEHVSLLKGIGFGICIVGIIFYNMYKLRKLKKSAASGQSATSTSALRSVVDREEYVQDSATAPLVAYSGTVWPTTSLVLDSDSEEDMVEGEVPTSTDDDDLRLDGAPTSLLGRRGAQHTPKWSYEDKWGTFSPNK